MDNKIKMFYKTRMSQGKTRLARILDMVVLHLGLFGIAYVYFLYLSRSVIAALVFAIAVVMLCSFALYLIRRGKLNRFIETQQKLLREKIAMEKLVMMERNSFISSMRMVLSSNGYEPIFCRNDEILAIKNGGRYMIKLFQYHPSHSLEAQDILETYLSAKRSGYTKCMIITTSPLSKDAESAMRRIDDLDIGTLAMQELYEMAGELGLLPSDEELENAVFAEMEEQRIQWSKVREKAVIPQKAKKYAVCGLIMLLASLITKYATYYYAFALVCFILAAFVAYKSRRAKEEEQLDA